MKFNIPKNEYPVVLKMNLFGDELHNCLLRYTWSLFSYHIRHRELPHLFVGKSKKTTQNWVGEEED